MSSIRQSLTVGIPTVGFHLDMVTEALGKSAKTLLLSEYLHNGEVGGDKGSRLISGTLKLSFADVHCFRTREAQKEEEKQRR